MRWDTPLPRAPFNSLRVFRANSGAPGCSPNRAAADPDEWQLQLVRGGCVAYFEVMIHAPADAANVSAVHDDFERNDCIAIGLCTQSFPLCGRQPGWDSHSYGYHSDDGSLFHGAGITTANAYGPRCAPCLIAVQLVDAT